MSRGAGIVALDAFRRHLSSRRLTGGGLQRGGRACGCVIDHDDDNNPFNNYHDRSAATSHYDLVIHHDNYHDHSVARHRE